MLAVRLFRPIHLSIRQKINLAFLLSVIAVSLIGFVAFRNLWSIERKLRFVSVARELHDTLLEVRRYEKNFLLYGQTEDYRSAQDFLAQSWAALERVKPDIEGFKGSVHIGNLQRVMKDYGHLLEELAEVADAPNDPSPRRDEIELKLRETGKALVDLSFELAEFEHARIKQILASLKAKLGNILLIMVVLGMFLVFLGSRKIVDPLKKIENMARSIARGEFKRLPLPPTHDETQSVVASFNKMVTELEKRQAQLVQAQKLSSLGVLTSGIAHQLNNPLNNISTSCQILLEELRDGEPNLMRMLTNIDQETDRARDIVKGLLEFSRERDFEFARVDVNTLVARTKQLLASQFPAAVQVLSEIPQGLHVRADAQKIQEVLLNLLLNAAQAMPDGKGTIRISAKEGPEFTEISVADDGSGISPENLQHIFDPFFSTKEVGYGTGLGLSVAHGIVERHHGTLTAKSQIGEGSTFTISLPVAREEEQEGGRDGET